MSNQARGSGKQEVQGVPPGSVQLLWDGQDGWQYFQGLTSFQLIPESSLDELAKGSNAGDQGFLPLLALGSTEGEISSSCFLLVKLLSFCSSLLLCLFLSLIFFYVTLFYPFSGDFGGASLSCAQTLLKAHHFKSNHSTRAAAPTQDGLPPFLWR